MGPLSNPVPSSSQNAYEPDDGSGYSFADDGTATLHPPVMRAADGSGARAAIAKHAQTRQARNSRIAGQASRPAPKVR